MPSKEEVDAAIATLERAISTIDTWILVLSALVAIGIAGELFFGVSHWLKDRELRPLRTLQAQLNDAEIAQLSNDAAQANLELAKLKGPRNLTPEAQVRIVEKLKPLGGKPFCVGILIGGLEPGSALPNQLIATLTSAGWHLTPWIAVPGQRGGPAPNNGITGIVGIVGVKIFFNAAKSGEFAVAADALSKELNKEGIAAIAESLPPDQAQPNAIALSIGAKT